MSITLNTKITISARLMFTTAMVAEIEGERTKVREFAKADRAKSAERRELLSPKERKQLEWMLSDMPTEELLERLFRAAMREYTKETIAGELSSDGQTFDRVQTAVTFVAKKVAE